MSPEDPDLKLGLAKFYMVAGNRAEFYRMIKEAVRLGGLPMREKIVTEPMFQQIQAEPDFQSLIRPTQ